jgi:uncharacterized membrane protein
VTEFALALAAFAAAHVLPAATGLRGPAIARVGRPAYVALYSVVSLGLLWWLVSATLRAPRLPLWEPAPWMTAAPLAAMAPASLLLAAAATRANPLSVAFRGGPPDAENPGVLALTRHPILWAFALWGASHALANGDVAAVILFGGSAALALAFMPVLERRARRRGETAAFDLARGPLGARLARAASPRLAAELAAGALLYLALLLSHEAVIGIDPLWRL